MARSTLRLGILAVSLYLVAAIPIAARPASGERSSRVQQLEAATAFAEWATAARDPLAMIAAARAMLAVGDESVRNADDALSPNGLLGAAAQIAPNDPTVAAIIADTLALTQRGILDGANRMDLQLAPGESRHFEMTFAAAELAEVSVRVMADAPGADVDVVILGANDKVVAGEVGDMTGVFGRSAYVRWIPDRCATFTVELRSVGAAPVDLRLFAAPSRSRSCIDQASASPK